MKSFPDIKNISIRHKYILVESTNIIRLSFLIYTMGFIIGIALGYHTGFVDVSGMTDVTPLSERNINVTLEGLVFHNMMTVLIITVGAATFGTLSILLGLYNGFVHGIIIGTLFTEFHDPGMVIALFAPHAILELPALFLAITAGLYVPINVYRFISEKQQHLLTTSDIILTVYIFILLEVIIISSSIIDYYITYSYILPRVV